MDHHTEYHSEILSALRAEGFIVNSIKFDGKIHRLPTERKPNKNNGAYAAYDQPVIRVWYKNWEIGQDRFWHPKDNRKLNKEERKKLTQATEKIRKAAERENAKRHAKAAILAQQKVDVARKCSNHPYLELKGISSVPGLKINSRGLLIVPFRDVAGSISTIQTISEDGKQKRFMLGGKKAGSFFSIGKVKKAKKLLVCEGLSTGISLYESCGLTVIVAGDKENLLPVAKALRHRHPDKKIVLCADNDIEDGSAANVGIEKASAAALAVNGLVAIPKLNSGSKCDFNELHTKEGEEAVHKCIKRASRPYDMPELSPLPHGYSFRGAGNKLDLYYEDMRLGRALYNLAQARDKKGKAWGRLVGCHDSDNNFHAEYISAGDLQAGNMSWMRTIANMGWIGTPESSVRKLLEQYLVYEVPHRVLLLACTGWHEDVYVLPDSVIGETQGEQPMLFPAPAHNHFGKRGTLKGWQKTIGVWAVGNSRVVMAICAALAGFLLLHYGWAESFGIHLFGKSSKGKSSSLQAAASCCGRGSLSGGYIHSWLMTENALEALAAASSDAPLILDEMGKADAHVVAKAAYTIAGGQGKVRLESDATMKQVRQWRCIVLSSGEKTFAGKLAEAKISPQAGQMVRLLDIPGDAGDNGVFENLHDHKSGKAFSKALKQAAIKNYGHVAPAFIERLAEEGYDAIARKLKKYQAKHNEELCNESVDGQVDRVADHFLLCAFAGKLATEYGILPWEKSEALRSVRKCFKAWLVTRGGTKAMEDEDIINRVKLFIERHGDSRFQTIGEDKSPTVRDRVGFKLQVKGQTRYLFLPESFRKEICKGWDATQAARILCQHGMLRRDKQSFLLKAPRKLPEMGRALCYTIIMPEAADK